MNSTSGKNPHQPHRGANESDCRSSLAEIMDLALTMDGHYSLKIPFWDLPLQEAHINLWCQDQQRVFGAFLWSACLLRLRNLKEGFPECNAENLLALYSSTNTVIAQRVCFN
jgi:hypothetical protein